ncbi:uncharacterized protein LOC119672193 [Teleopsis dalmanni]|uniref:uncharacterized protein LOC119672193 n=1 Tax=Teleopsis dalmanni TaxID=139649 RepID=UPI0018CDDA69|nr:uncharacterized protein LOC119672193 [Teleopsis dalmanni]
MSFARPHESIYNPPSDIMDMYENLEMALIVTSTNENETIRQILCTFKLFKKQIIAQQCVHQKWENMKNPLLNNTESLCTYIGSKIIISTIFQNLIWEENTIYNPADINIEEDYALICNSVHRFALTTEIHRTVENLIGSDKHTLLVELYKSEEPETVFMQGVLDLSILLYPNVNVGRFSMKLNRVQMVRRSKRRGTQSINKTFSKKTVEDVNKLTFAIIAVSFLTPITELSDEIVEYTESEISKLNLTPNSIIDYDVVPPPTPPDISPNVLYRTLDGFISSFTECVVRKKKPDCGFVVETLNDIITAIVYAHSKRNVPEDYIELNELLAVTYNDLEFRINERVKNFLETDLLSKLSYKSNETMVFELMSCMKYMYEAGNEQFGNQLYNKLQNEQSNNLYYQFFMFLYNLEKRKYLEVQTYLSKPQEQRLFGTEYFEDLIQIYINYIESLQKTKINQAIGELIKELRNFANKNYKDITVWILLYCLYYKSYYKPGISYARWKFMCLYDTICTELPEIPISLWQIYNNHELTFKSKRCKNFYRTMKFLLQLGLYKFGELIFLHLTDQLPAIEDYITMITFTLISGESNSKFKIRNFDGYRSNTPRLALILEQLNGCLEDCRGDSEAAQNYYQLILRNEDKSLSYEDVQLSLLRYAFAAYAKASFESAIESLKLFIITDKDNVIINLFIGKAFYKMKQFEEAFEYLKKSTFQGIHMPEIWVLLALVSLQLGNNYSALECWKYANIKPDTQFSEEIYEELKNIDVRKVSLQVKRPNSHIPCVKTKFKKLKRNKDF